MEEENVTDGVPDALKNEVKSRWKLYLGIIIISAMFGGSLLNAGLLFYPQNWYGYDAISTWLTRHCEPQCKAHKDAKDQLEKNLGEQINLLNLELVKCKCKAGNCD